MMQLMSNFTEFLWIVCIIINCLIPGIQKPNDRQDTCTSVHEEI